MSRICDGPMSGFRTITSASGTSDASCKVFAPPRLYPDTAAKIAVLALRRHQRLALRLQVGRRAAADELQRGGVVALRVRAHPRRAAAEVHVGRFRAVGLVHHQGVRVGQHRVDLEHVLPCELVEGLLRQRAAAFQVCVRRRAEERRPLLGGVW
eukprot:6195724-Pleurochrysis_carterae.AAC.5